ncbi:GNAT family N-acetyltransferase [Halobacillus sp. A5]|uniref:GNAT family N-acetyltransferase n=1 Tax=Halobacillus sp. A5 TaxID=2880263 RepID=UPI0020A6883E|nr:GNAT family N-acetyltransferase [Halobacillus sp. A5]MCP3029287.1 N-acetyltransferase [Halobacillus sp. A5]
MARIQQEEGRFYIKEGGETAAEMKFEEEDSVITITHTHVVPPMQGKGMATELVEFAAEYARKYNKKINPVCSFAKQVLEDDESFRDVL